MSLYDLDVHDYGPLSIKGVLFYFHALYKIWRTDVVQLTTSLVGTLSLGAAAFGIARYVWANVKPSTVQVYCHSQSGSWVLVTGASDGIGRGFAQVFLERGFNVLLHGRNAEKLMGVRDELAKAFPSRKIDFVVADASRHDDAYLGIAEKARNLPGNGKLTVLVNNVGGVPFSPQFWTHDEIPHEYIDACLNINARFPTQLTRALLPLLKSNGPSLILNCSSIVGRTAVLYLTTYGATKAYVESFTRSLHTDLLATGDSKAIEVLGFWIGNVTSGGNQTHVPLLTLTSKQCAERCLSRVGSGEVMVCPSWRFQLMKALSIMLPEATRDKLMAAQMRQKAEAERKRQ